MAGKRIDFSTLDSMFSSCYIDCEDSSRLFETLVAVDEVS